MRCVCGERKHEGEQQKEATKEMIGSEQQVESLNTRVWSHALMRIMSGADVAKTKQTSKKFCQRVRIIL